VTARDNEVLRHENEALRRRLAEAEQVNEALTKGQVDAVVDAAHQAPLLLRQAQDALRESEEQFRAMFNLTSVGVAQADPVTGRWLAINPRMCLITGYSAAELLGMRIPEITHPEDRQRDWDLFQEVVKGEAPEYKLEKRYMRKDGSIAWVNVNMVVLRDAAGKPTRTVATIEDITERRGAAEVLAKSEAYFRSIIENTPDVVAVLDFDGTVRYASRSVEPTIGYRPDELVGRSVLDLVHPEDRAVVESRLRAVRNSAETQHLEVRLGHRNGSWSPISIMANRLPSAAGNGIVVNARDLTERIKLERQFLQAQKMEAVGRLAGGVAHDFNNLLTVIQGYGELLEKSVAGRPEERDGVDQILKASARAAALTKQLLAFSRLQVLDMKVLDLGVVVAGTEKMLRRLISEDIEIVVTKPELTGRVKADEGQLVQVLMNLAVNARDAMPGGGRLTIALADEKLDETLPGTPDVVPPGRYVVISVTDTGQGIDEKSLGQIFEPFFTTKEMGKGTGLGLSTVYGIVRQSGGYMGVESVPGNGSTFRVYMPRCDDPASSGSRSAVRALSGNETILVVEDEPAVRNIAKTLLERRGYTVVLAESGRAALDIATRDPRPIHVLLTDLVMPEMNGRDLAVRLRVLRPAIKVVFMSGYAGDAAGNLAPGPGSGFLAKPFTERALTARIREVLDAPLA
jgi:PAS domain S-box-containing protein